MREKTVHKEKEVLKGFRKLLRSGKDYTTSYMYEEAGIPCFISGKTAGNIVRKHYRKTITDEMVEFILNVVDGLSHDEKIVQFSKEFRLCKRESRLIIRYIKCNE